jgi:hypothetical protein
MPAAEGCCARLLAGDQEPGTASQPPRETRGVIGSDDRTRVTVTTSWPASAIGFNQSRGTGNRIGRSTIYTAAHVVYNRTDTSVAFGWYCYDETTSPTGSCPLPQWRFGVNDTSGASAWTPYACYGEFIPTSWLSVTSSTDEWSRARWDYALVDITSCGLVNTGWIGTWITSDQQLSTMSVQDYGYAERALCPSNSDGEDGMAGPNNTVTGTSCPGTGSWPRSTWQLTGTASPFAGARLWRTSTGSVAHGDNSSAYTIKSTLDVTHGDSGSAQFFGLNSPTDYRAIGVVSGSDTAYNVLQRWTGETYNFFVANSRSFPNDTQ